MSDLFLIVFAVLPAAALMAYICKKDKLEKESPALLRSLALCGVISTVPAILLEAAGSAAAQALFPHDGFLYAFTVNFIVIAVVEEGVKFCFLRRASWHSPEFNCQFDGVVYAVFVSLGFALLENILYVLRYGFGVAVARALLSVPGHGCFGVFIGAFYGLAKRCANYGCPVRSRKNLRLSVLIPALLHGMYDFIASTEYINAGAFLAFIGAIFFLGVRLTNKLSKEDRYIDAKHWYSL